IRDFHVTGVQTCALPISRGRAHRPEAEGSSGPAARALAALVRACGSAPHRATHRVRALVDPGPAAASGTAGAGYRLRVGRAADEIGRASSRGMGGILGIE